MQLWWSLHQQFSKLLGPLHPSHLSTLHAPVTCLFPLTTMLRCPARPLVSLLLSARPLLLLAATRPFAVQTSAGDATVEDLEAARRWLEKLDPDTIPKSICDLSFSRSSGPGGQNVNK
jgi:hypothetical protein